MCDDVILSGGGNYIPALQNALHAGAVKMFGSACRVRVPPNSPVHSSKLLLTNEQVRGGSAIGGCSVYFDAER